MDKVKENKVKDVTIVSLSAGTLGEQFAKHELQIGLKRLEAFGLNVHFSGYLHRAVLQQDVDVADIRNMIISDKLIKTFKKATGYDYPLDKSLLKDTYTEEENSLFVKKSLQFCNKLKEQGIGIMYEPKLGNEYYNSDAEKETKVEDEA